MVNGPEIMQKNAFWSIYSLDKEKFGAHFGVNIGCQKHPKPVD